MKRIGPGGVSWKLERILRVRVTMQRQSFDFAYSLQPPEYLPDPRYIINFELMQEVNGYAVRTLDVEMACRFNGNDERAREELLASRQVVSKGVSSDCDLWDESDEPVTVVIEDFNDIMSWLFPNMDLNEFFNQTKNQNAKPLRPVKEITGPGQKKLTGRRPAGSE